MSTTRKESYLENERFCLCKNGFYVEKRRKKYPEIVKVREGYIAEKVEAGNVIVVINNIRATELNAEQILNWQKQDPFTCEIRSAPEYNIMLRDERNVRRRVTGINRRDMMSTERADRKRQADVVGRSRYSIVIMTM